ncbi:hemolysin activation/secretion protein [Nitrosomonas sp. PY1]|uniref:ShlB/FhaC/HecB family hemolysin secretion/activation protein n=1 Tax=Nitrosomonas sp. PY1 TaxID=1803906 RepID=UPI001FC86830|nr:POTRA domain-containing protein [Nitrosomonas sp. PY1]GKS69053.1 hemolysin activation/secretion protein [Nitrosomonas sp. PY1]
MKKIGGFLLLAVAIFFYGNVESQPLPTNPASAPAQSQSFSVKSIHIQGNTLLPENKLMVLIAYLIGDDRTLNDLVQGATTVQQAYREAGYIGVIAFVPEQKLENGNVIIQVLEGKIDKINISGLAERDEINILRSLPHLEQGETPVARNIDRNIQMANENPTKKLRVTLVAGANPGGINVDTKVTDERPLRLLFGVDSAGTPGTGNFRTNVGIQHANLWNRDHIGTFQFQTSPTEPSRAQIYSVGYRIPFYSQFAALDAFYAHSNVESLTSAASVGVGPFGFTGKGDVAGFRAHRFLPRLGEYDHRVTLGWDWRYFNNNCTFGGNSGIAACDRIAANVTIAPVSFGYIGQKDGPIFSWGINTNISGNFGGSNQATFNAARLDADKHYVVWRFFGFTNWNLPAGFGLATRVLAQYSPHALVPGEQFGIGGGGSAMGGFISVRGYREREVVGDYGTSFNIEGLGPDFAKLVNSESLNLRPLGFFDFGWVGNNYHMPCNAHGSPCELASVGGGIRFAIGKKFSGRLDFGYALVDGTQKAAGTSRGHLAVNFHY